MGSLSERRELAKLCSAKNWSKAIRVLDALLAHSSSIQDICNRAFCYSRLELHKHVIKDCDKALQLDPLVLQAYILKGKALLALGRKDDALHVLEQGYQNAVRQSTDLKQLLDLEELLADVKQTKSIVHEDHVMDSSDAITSMFGVDSEVCCQSDDTLVSVVDSENHNKSDDTLNTDMDSEINSKPEVTYEIYNHLSDATEAHNSSNETIKINSKFFVTRNAKTKSISVDFRLSRGIAEVNEGKYNEAISIFDQILKENPSYPEALIGRGTAYAFKRELDAAIADFTKALHSNPSAAEAWKRRGQARAAMGESAEAIEDLTKALKFEPNSSDILHERGIVNFKFKDYDSAVEDLSTCVLRDKKNKSAYTYLGLALAAVGEYSRSEEQLLKSIQIDRNYLEGWAHLAQFGSLVHALVNYMNNLKQFYQDLANLEKPFDCLQQALLVDGRFAKAYHLRGLLYHGTGQHRTAIKDLSLGLSIEGSNIECLYLRASCYHAIGEYRDAVKDYDAVLDLELDSMDKFVLQCLAFYQKEIALYTASKINSDFCWFDIDGDVDPLFKEYWCKRLHPKHVCEKVFRQPPLRESLKKNRLRKQESVVTKNKSTLLQAADFIGQKIQYNCPGFLPNRRQYRMGGLAAIEIAQKVSKAWRSLRNISKSGKKTRKREKVNMPSQNRGGAGCSTSDNTEPSTSYGSNEEKCSSGCSLSWQDIYTIAVKWRQISEPCDPVVWVNKLTEEFNSGFGSNTPMLLGQAKVVRYFPNYQRTLNMAKSIIWVRKYVNNSADNTIDLSDAGKLQKILHAGSCSDLYNIIGENFWVATTCDSSAFEGKRLEGTRITVQKLDKGFDFAIRTPCTPSRWGDYDREMAMAWEALCNIYSGEVYGSNDLSALEEVRDAILRMTYYWYNFMPLSRGSAVVGYVVMLGLLLATNMEVTGNIPQGVQVDWEAIMTPSPDAFIDSVKTWLDPSIRINTTWKDYPDVVSTFNTTASVVAALSTYDA